VAVTVADGGPGVADADRERLFARYARGGRSEDRDGTGLGLYVGRALARANGGDLVLELADAQAGQGTASDTGPGAAFSLLLPAEAPTEG
jgi:signal transduction histidine kinase